MTMGERHQLRQKMLDLQKVLWLNTLSQWIVYLFWGVQLAYEELLKFDLKGFVQRLSFTGVH